LRWFRI